MWVVSGTEGEWVGGQWSSGGLNAGGAKSVISNCERIGNRGQILGQTTIWGKEMRTNGGCSSGSELKNY